jgi:hypothetical protein
MVADHARGRYAAGDQVILPALGNQFVFVLKKQAR